jgi:hypothetical protein
MDTYFEEKKIMRNETSLKIVKKGQKTLSKNQQLFNNLTKRIENLEAGIKNEGEKLNRVLIQYSKKVEPLQKEIGNVRINLAKTIANSTFEVKYTKKQLENIREVIIDLCNDAFIYVEPDPKQEDFYDAWAEISYKDEIEEQMENNKDIFSDMLKEMHGININFDDIDLKSENFSEIQQKIMEEFEKSKQNGSNTDKKKTKKQLEIEAEQKAEEEIKNRSIRSIYIALAKVIHPDTETDLILKAEKEEIMKQVTSAYDRKDLPTLLKLEMEWVHKESEHLEKLSEEKLNIYISALKQQVKDLEQQKKMLYMHPRFMAIFDMVELSEKTAMSRIQNEVRENNHVKKALIHFIKEFEKPNSKKQILQFVKEYQEKNAMRNVLEQLMNNIF